MTIPSSGGDQRGLAGARDVASVWQRLIAAKAAQPFLTYHDDTTGERVELSYATFGNWLSKTANLVQDDLLAGPGDRIVVSARPHWLTAVWLVAPLFAGAVVDPWGEAKSAHTVVAGPDESALAAARECSGERLALSLLPLGRPFDAVPDGFRDYSAEVRAFADHFVSFNPPRPDMEALVLNGETVTHGELIERAAVPATAQAPARVLIEVREDRFTGTELLDWLFGPLLNGASIVLVHGAAPQRLDRIAEMERVNGRFTLG